MALKNLNYAQIQSCKVPVQTEREFFSSRRPPRYLAPRRVPPGDIPFKLGHLSLNFQALKGDPLNSPCGCREKPVGPLSVPPPVLSSFLPGITTFCLSAFSHGDTSSQVKYHSLKQLSLGQHEARYPIQELVRTEQARSTPSPRCPASCLPAPLV